MASRPSTVIRTIHELSDDALVARDAVLSGHRDAQILAIVENLMKHSIAMHRRQYPRRHPERHTHWTNRLGLITSFAVRGEHSYVCVYCGDNVVTLSNKGRTLTDVIMRRLELHGWSCGLRYLMQRGGHDV